tara:strand:- start:83 stop:529 length:447 start_codon:yes stop_codon:yes gene_type:complete
MKFISHRGNINGVEPSRENTLEYIQEALDAGFDVEVDLWIDGDRLLLGHDYGEHEVTHRWLWKRRFNLWIHCKHFSSLAYMQRQTDSFQYFFHEKEDYTIISNQLIWAHNLQEVNNRCVIPLLSEDDIDNWTKSNVFGICSDFIGKLK